MILRLLQWLALALLAASLNACAATVQERQAPTATLLAITTTATRSPAPSTTPTASPAATATTTPSPTPAPPSPAPSATLAPGPAPSATAVEQVYVFPVRSQGKLSYGKYHHDYPAADIFCPIGSKFVAVTAGVVDFVSREDTWSPRVNDGATRGGLSVAIVGDDGVRYYGSHLSQVADGIEPGVRVVAGQLLGLTGKSGDAATTAAHLHFGISHPTTPADWAVRRGELAPYQYLRAWQKGENIAPKLP